MCAGVHACSQCFTDESDLLVQGMGNFRTPTVFSVIEVVYTTHMMRACVSA